MRNPLNEILTPSEQKALLFLALCFMIGTGLNLLGWKPSSPLLANQSLEDAPPESLATALKEDVPIIIDIRVATQAELEELPGIGAKRAQEIIAHRAKTPFNNVNEIM
nr:helix-hairpin-helix domain-containing protein [Candidatus Cloacimonadota bacterium]